MTNDGYKLIRSVLSVLLIGIMISYNIYAAEGVPTPFPYEADIQAFEENDRIEFPPLGATLFIGSSSIRKWTTLKDDMAPHTVINRGFGGSEAYQVIHYFNRIVAPYKPKKIFFYEGDNDLGEITIPTTVDQFIANCKLFVQMTHEVLPETKIYFLSIKHSPSREHLKTKYIEANNKLKAYADANQHDLIEFIDVCTPLYTNGVLNPLYFDSKDRLHLTDEGYAVWTSVVKPWVAEDIEKPVISFKNADEESMLAPYGSTFSDPGVNVTDNQDYNLVANAKVFLNDIEQLNGIDTFKPGVYEIRYNVSDQSGNAAKELVRKVRVLTQEVIIDDIVYNDSQTMIQQVNIINGSGKSVNGTLMLATYNAEDRLTKVIYKPIALENIIDVISCDYSDNQVALDINCRRIKVFIWESIQVQKPIAIALDRVVHDNLPPSVPSNLLLLTGDGMSASLRWDAATDNVGVAEYVIYDGTDIIGTLKQTSTEVVNLAPDKAYNFSVKARDDNGNLSDSSNKVVFNTQPLNYNIEVIGRENNVVIWGNSALGVDNAVSVLVSNPQENIEYLKQQKIEINNCFNFKFSIDNPMMGTYLVKIGESRTAFPYTTSFEIGSGNNDTIAPSAPYNLNSAYQGENCISISWQASTDEMGIDKYYIYNGKTLVGAAKQTNCTIANLSPATQYQVTIIAKDNSGNLSNASMPITISTSE